VNDTNAAFAIAQVFANKVGKCVTSFIPIHAVQVNFILNKPSPAPQITQNIVGQTCPQVIGLVATFLSVLKTNFGVRSFVQFCVCVSEVLQRTGWRLRAAQLNPI
jgi:hypothetical protein